LCQTTGLAETNPTFWATVFVRPADFPAQQLILAVDQHPHKQNDVLPVVKVIDVGRLVHGGMREPKTNAAYHRAKTLRSGRETALV
jgi:hypothetical protein